MSFPPTDLHFSKASNESVTTGFFEYSSDKSKQSLIPQFCTMSDGSYKKDGSSRRDKLGRAKSFLSIFQREREDGSFPISIDSEGMYSIQNFAPDFNQIESSRLPELVSLDGEYYDGSKENLFSVNDVQAIPLDETQSAPTILPGTTDTTFHSRDERAIYFDVLNTSPTQMYDSLELNGNPDQFLREDKGHLDSDSAHGSSPDPFAMLIREIDHAPAQLTNSPARDVGCKSLHASFHYVARQEAYNFSVDFNKRVLFKEKSNEVRLFSRSESELELFTKKSKVFVRNPQTTHASSLLIPETKPEKESEFSPGPFADIFNVMSQSFKSLESSAVNIKDRISTWTNTFNLPEILCAVPTQEDSLDRLLPKEEHMTRRLMVSDDVFTSRLPEGLESSMSYPFTSTSKNRRRHRRPGSATSYFGSIQHDEFLQDAAVDFSESTEIMLREVKGQRFVAFGENENAIPLYDDPTVSFVRKKSVVEGARRWAKTQLIASPQQLSLKRVNDDSAEKMIPLSLDDPLLSILEDVHQQASVHDGNQMTKLSSMTLLARRHLPLKGVSLPL